MKRKLLSIAVLSSLALLGTGVHAQSVVGTTTPNPNTLMLIDNSTPNLNKALEVKGTTGSFLVVGVDGKVGVGTNAPSVDLEVADSDANGQATITANFNGSNTDFTSVKAEETASSIYMRNLDATGDGSDVSLGALDGGNGYLRLGSTTGGAFSYGDIGAVDGQIAVGARIGQVADAKVTIINTGSSYGQPQALAIDGMPAVSTAPSLLAYDPTTKFVNEISLTDAAAELDTALGAHDQTLDASRNLTLDGNNLNIRGSDNDMFIYGTGNWTIASKTTDSELFARLPANGESGWLRSYDGVNLKDSRLYPASIQLGSNGGAALNSLSYTRMYGHAGKLGINTNGDDPTSDVDVRDGDASGSATVNAIRDPATTQRAFINTGSAWAQAGGVNIHGDLVAVDANDGATRLLFQDSGGTTAELRGSNETFIFRNGTTDEVVRITPEGNMGIGDNTPTRELIVRDGDDADDWAIVSVNEEGVAGDNWLSMAANNSTNMLNFKGITAGGREATLAARDDTNVSYVRLGDENGVASMLYGQDSFIGIGSDAPAGELDVKDTDGNGRAFITARNDLDHTSQLQANGEGGAVVSYTDGGPYFRWDTNNVSSPGIIWQQRVDNTNFSYIENRPGAAPYFRMTYDSKFSTLFGKENNFGINNNDPKAPLSFGSPAGDAVFDSWDDFQILTHTAATPDTSTGIGSKAGVLAHNAAYTHSFFRAGTRRVDIASNFKFYGNNNNSEFDADGNFFMDSNGTDSFTQAFINADGTGGTIRNYDAVNLKDARMHPGFIQLGYEGGAALTPNSYARLYALSGRLGLGTDAPTHKLTVNGNAANTTGTWDVFSDKRVKKDIDAYEAGLDEIMAINPVTFRYSEDSPFGEDKATHVGVIAQEIAEVAPYMVSRYNTKTTAEGEDYLMLNPGAFTYMLVNAVQDLKTQQDEKIATLVAANKTLKTGQNDKIAALETENVLLKTQMSAIKAELGELDMLKASLKALEQRLGNGQLVQAKLAQ